jgi:hypothetical protein
MATVGYGDIIPQTIVGKTIATLVMITSIIFLGLPTTIFSANLSELYAQLRIVNETTRRLEIRRKSVAAHKRKNDVELMIQDMEAEMSILRSQLDRLAETHKGVLLCLKDLKSNVDGVEVQ